MLLQMFLILVRRHTNQLPLIGIALATTETVFSPWGLHQQGNDFVVNLNGIQLSNPTINPLRESLIIDHDANSSAISRAILKTVSKTIHATSGILYMNSAASTGGNDSSWETAFSSLMDRLPRQRQSTNRPLLLKIQCGRYGLPRELISRRGM